MKSYLLKKAILQFSSTSFYETHQALHNMKHGKSVISWSTPRKLYYGARQARQFFEARKAPHFMKHSKHVSSLRSRARKARQNAKHIKHAAKHASTQARHLPDPKVCFYSQPTIKSKFLRKTCLIFSDVNVDVKWSLW